MNISETRTQFEICRASPLGRKARRLRETHARTPYRGRARVCLSRRVSVRNYRPPAKEILTNHANAHDTYGSSCESVMAAGSGNGRRKAETRISLRPVYSYYGR
jgi:hypothetical protein